MSDSVIHATEQFETLAKSLNCLGRAFESAPPGVSKHELQDFILIPCHHFDQAPLGRPLHYGVLETGCVAEMIIRIAEHPNAIRYQRPIEMSVFALQELLRIERNPGVLIARPVENGVQVSLH